MAFTQVLNIIPRPARLITNIGSFVITPKPSLVVTGQKDYVSATYLNECLQDYFGFQFIVVSKAARNAIKFQSLSNSEEMKEKDTA